MKLFKSRRDKLKNTIEFEINSVQPDINYILTAVDNYEKDNLKTIKTLKRKKTITLRKINGAIKSFLTAHPILTKQLIGSLGKRIYGNLLNPSIEPKISKRELNIKLLRIILEIGLIIYVIYTLCN